MRFSTKAAPFYGHRVHLGHVMFDRAEESKTSGPLGTTLGTISGSTVGHLQLHVMLDPD